MKLLVQPYGHGLRERLKTLRRVRKIGFDEAIELKKRLVIEPDVIDLARLEPGLFQTETNGMYRKFLVVFLSCETLFLSGSHDFAVYDKSGRGVMIKGGNPKYRGHSLLNPGASLQGTPGRLLSGVEQAFRLVAFKT